ncbi:MAG: recombinase family protein [Lachnospiraceae bacterium]|nr:recombinase family protein [Lachnospiraceae bacterium]
MQFDKIDASYIRLSLEDEEVARGIQDESGSIASQRICIDEYVRSHPNVPKELTEFVDDGYSGTSMERPAMQKLLQLVTMGRVRTIIVRDLSRFARNYLEAGHYLEFVFPSYDVRIISINDNYDSDDYDQDGKGFEIAIRNLLNDWYSKDISRKIKSAVDMKKLRGEYVYGTAPYGYKKGEKKNTIVIDPEAAEVVHRIFACAVKGMTITEIAKMLNEEKVTTPSVYLACVRGKYKTYEYWTFESVRNILINRIYTGDTVPFKSHVVRVGSNRVKMIPEEEQIVIPDTHEGIISREMFYQARLVIKTNKKGKKNTNKNPLSGYLVCGCCGHKLTKGRTTNKNWLCATQRYTEEMGCKSIRLNEEMMRSKLLSAIQLQCKIADASIDEARKGQNKEFAVLESLRWDLKKAERNLDESRNALLGLMDEYYDGKCTKEEFLEKKLLIKDNEDKCKAKVEDLKGQVATVKKRISDQLADESDAGRVVKHKDIETLDAGIMRELVKQIVVYPDNAVHIDWNFAL